MTTNGRVVPGIKYGVFVGQNIPSCRSVNQMLHWLSLSEDCEVAIKLPEDIHDDDRCQRGPNGKPLHRVTPLVPFQTLAEWKGVTGE